MSYIVDNEFLKKLEVNKQKKLLPLLEVILREYAPIECKIMSQENLDRFLYFCYISAQKNGTQNVYLKALHRMLVELEEEEEELLNSKEKKQLKAYMIDFLDDFLFDSSNLESLEISSEET